MDQIVINDTDIRRGIINETNPIPLLNNNFYDDVNLSDLYHKIMNLTEKDFTEVKMYIVFQDVFQDDNKIINDSIYIEWHRSGCGLKKIQIYNNTLIQYDQDFNYLSLAIYNQTTSGSGSLKIAMKKNTENEKIFTKWNDYLQAAKQYMTDMALSTDLSILNRLNEYTILNRYLKTDHSIAEADDDGLEEVDDDDDDLKYDTENGGKLRKQRKSRKRKNKKKRKSRKRRKSRTRRKSKTWRKSRKQRKKR